jgi:hypothetical protein
MEVPEEGRARHLHSQSRRGFISVRSLAFAPTRHVQADPSDSYNVVIPESSQFHGQLGPKLPICFYLFENENMLVGYQRADLRLGGLPCTYGRSISPPVPRSNPSHT